MKRNGRGDKNIMLFARPKLLLCKILPGLHKWRYEVFRKGAGTLGIGCKVCKVCGATFLCKVPEEVNKYGSKEE